jgi:hypothetical protein
MILMTGGKADGEEVCSLIGNFYGSYTTQNPKYTVFPRDGSEAVR